MTNKAQTILTLASSLIFLISGANALGAEPFSTYGKCYALYVESCKYGCWDEDGNPIKDNMSLVSKHADRAGVMWGYARNSARGLSSLDGFDAGADFSASAAEEQERLAVLSALDGKARAEEYRRSKIDSLKCDYVK